MKKVYIKVCLNLQNMYYIFCKFRHTLMLTFFIAVKEFKETALFSGKIYTADKSYTRPPVATVATNFKSGHSFDFEYIETLQRETDQPKG